MALNGAGPEMTEEPEIRPIFGKKSYRYFKFSVLVSIKDQTWPKSCSKFSLARTRERTADHGIDSKYSERKHT